MLYKLTPTRGKIDRIEPVPFKDLSELQQQEKDLEQLIAQHMLDVLFENDRLMTVFQERSRQPEADIYALNEEGELTVFELKRGVVDEGAVHQVLRYAQDAGQWSYAQLQAKYQQYSSTESKLRSAHQEAFGLEHPLDARQFNNKQHLIVIGNSANESLINAVNYWRRQGLSIIFLPYRIYELGGEQYFEFFSPPYDQHMNPANRKGVLFDTCRTYWEEGIWCMMENCRVAAFGDAKRFVEYVHPGDIVFFSHRWDGIVAAARVKRGSVHAPDEETLYRDVEFMTSIPTRNQKLRAMPFRMVCEVTGKRFYWARTIKVPYLSMAEAEVLAQRLSQYLEKG